MSRKFDGSVLLQEYVIVELLEAYRAIIKYQHHSIPKIFRFVIFIVIFLCLSYFQS